MSASLVDHGRIRVYDPGNEARHHRPEGSTVKIAALVLIAAVLAACASGSSTASAAARRRAEPAVREAVFRALFEHNASGLGDKAGAYYIRWQEADPDAGFLARFAGQEPPVRPASRCDAGKEKGVIDRETGERGLLFTIDSIEWLSDGEAVVTAKYYEAGLSAAGYRILVVWNGTRFKVEECSMLWIS
jgi:hypothetical protein